MARTRDKGRTQRRSTHTARSREPNLIRFYRRMLRPVDPRDLSFRLDLLRGRGFPPLALDRVTQSFDWADEESMLTGSLQLRRPEQGNEESLPIERGHQVRCRVQWRERWSELWRMRCEAPITSLDSEGVAVTVELRDDLNLVRRGSRKYLYRASKKRKHGWFGHEALIDAARRDGIKLGRLARCTKRSKKIRVHGSFLDLAKKVYEDERDRSGRRFVMRMRAGKFEVVEFRRNKLLYVLSRAIVSASVEERHKVAKPVTVIAARARIGKGDDAKKVRYTYFRREFVGRYGWVRKEKDYGRVGTFAELKRKVHREMAQQYLVDETLTVTHPGLPFLHRGDGARAVLPSEGFEDEDSFVWVRQIRHTVSGGKYDMETTLVRDDPFVKYERRQEKDRRERLRKARERRRRRGDD